MPQNNQAKENASRLDQGKTQSKPKSRLMYGSHPTFLALAVFVLLLLAQELTTGNYVNSSNPYLSTVIIQLVVFLLPCAFYCTLKRTGLFNGCRVKPLKSGGILCVLCGIPAVIFASAAAKYVQCYLFDVRLGSSVPISSYGDFTYLLLSLAIVPSIVEELCFRGVILTEYEKSFGKCTAVVASSVLFSLMHFNVRDFAAYFVSGLIIGITVCVTDSVIAGIVMHFCSNLVNIYADNILVRISTDASGGRLALFVILAATLAFLMLWLYRIEKIYKELAKREEKQPSVVGERMRFLPEKMKLAKAFGHVFITPAFGCVLIVFVIKLAIG